MALQHAYSNHNNAAEYQISSIPFTKTQSIAAGAEVKISFPYITRFLVLYTSAEDAHLLFSETGNDGGKTNWFVVKSGSTTPRLEIKCREIWIKNPGGGATTISVLAGLTNIAYSQFPDLAGIEGIG